MIIEMASAGAKFRLGQAGFSEARIAETGVGVLVVALEIEAVLDQRSASESVVADTIAMNPWIQQRQ